MKFDTVIFDWDGTLAKTLHLWLEGWKTELLSFDMALPDRKIAQDFFYEHHKGQLKYPHINFETSAATVRHHVECGLEQLVLYADAHDTILDVKSRVRNVALVTSSSRDLVEKGLTLHGLHTEFHSVLAGSDGHGHKPSPKPFHETLKRLDADPKTTLVIGDAAADILAARAAGCQSCLFMPVENKIFQDRGYLAGLAPDFTINALSEMGDLI